VLEEKDVHPALPSEDSLSNFHMISALGPHLNALMRQLEDVSTIRGDLGTLQSMARAPAGTQLPDADVDAVEAAVLQLENTVHNSITSMRQKLIMLAEAIEKRRSGK